MVGVKHASTALKWLLIGIGTVSVALGIVGIFVPLLPTTPFLLLAAACYARSSQRLNDWLLGNHALGHYIRDYREGRGIPARTKITVLVFLWTTMAASAWFAVPRERWWVNVILAVIGTTVTIHILRMKTRIE